MSSEANSTRRISKETMERLAGKKKAGSLRCGTCFFYEDIERERDEDGSKIGYCFALPPSPQRTLTPADHWCAEHRLADYGTTRS